MSKENPWRTSESLENYLSISQHHKNYLKKNHAPWKHNIEKWGVDQNFCTVQYYSKFAFELRHKNEY